MLILRFDFRLGFNIYTGEYQDAGVSEARHWKRLTSPWQGTDSIAVVRYVE